MKTPAIVLIHLRSPETALLNKLKAETGLSKSFIIRRCITHSLPLFVSNQLDLLTLRGEKSAHGHPAAVVRANELSVSVGAVRGGEWQRALAQHGGKMPPLPSLRKNIEKEYKKC